MANTSDTDGEDLISIETVKVASSHLATFTASIEIRADCTWPQHICNWLHEEKVVGCARSVKIPMKFFGPANSHSVW